MLKRHNKNSNSSPEKSYFDREKSYSGLRKSCFSCRKTCSGKSSCFSILEVCSKLSGVCLFLLTLLMINPATTSASALKGDEGAGVNYNDQISTRTESIVPSGQISTQADDGVTISFGSASGSSSLTPGTSGATAKVNLTATVSIASTGGYTIYLGGELPAAEKYAIIIL